MTIILNGTTGITTPDIDSTAGLDAADLTGALPAISGASLTNLTSANLTGALPAISGASLTNLTSANLTGALPAIDGAALTGLPEPKANVFTIAQSTSGTFTVPFDCTMLIQLIGAGGSGARLANQYGTNRTALATGGASGGVSLKTVTATAGQTFTVTIGAGVATSSSELSNTGENGTAGGNSSVTGPNVSMTANGGGGGIFYSSSTYDPTKTITSGAGGAASGGDTNLNGNTSTAEAGLDTGTANYSLVVGCSSGAAAGRIIAETTSSFKINSSSSYLTYASAVSQGAATSGALSPFAYYQTEQSLGSSAMFFLATTSSYYSKMRSTDDGPSSGWNGKYGGGSGAAMNSCYNPSFTVRIAAGEGGVTSGDGICLFTLFEAL